MTIHWSDDKLEHVCVNVALSMTRHWSDDKLEHVCVNVDENIRKLVR